MNPEKKKLLIFLSLIVALSLSVILVLIGFNKITQKEAQEAPGNSVQPHQEHKDLPSNTIYRNGDENEESIEEDEHSHSDEEPESEAHFHSHETTIFDNEEDDVVAPFIINKPEKVANAEMPSVLSDVFYANDGYIFVFAEEQEIQYFDPTRNTYLALENNVLDVNYSDNGTDILFQKHEGGKYNLYRFDYKKNTKGFQLIASDDYRFKTYGIIDEVLYTTRDKFENEVAFYPLNPDDLEVPAPFASTYYDHINAQGNFFIGYNNNLGLLEARNKLGESIFKSPAPTGENVTALDLKIRTHSNNSLSYLSIFSKDEYLLEKSFIHNGTEIPELNAAYQTDWINNDYIVVNEANYSEYLYLYNLKTGDRYDLDSNVRSMFYDEIEKTIYYNKYESEPIYKIVLE